MQIGPALAGPARPLHSLKIVTFRDDDEVLSLAGGADGQAAASAGPITPDQIVYCTSFPLWFEPAAGETPAQLVERLKAAVTEQHAARRRAVPAIVLVKGLGLFSAGGDFAAADVAGRVYLDAIKVMAGGSEARRRPPALRRAVPLHRELGSNTM